MSMRMATVPLELINPATDVSALPEFIDRRSAAAIVSARLFPVSRRTLETWPLALKTVNGRALVRTAEVLAFARAKLDAAPVIRAGRRQPESLAA